jgi:hypothetical protein
MQSRPGAGQRCPSDAAETFDTSGKQPRNAILARMIAAQANVRQRSGEMR